MRRLLPLLAAFALTAPLAACGDAGADAAATDSTQSGVTVAAGGKKDAGTQADTAAAADVVAQAGKTGDPCAGDVQCTSAACVGGTCATACKSKADCGADQDCASDDGKRTFCHTRTYSEDIGSSCAISGKCAKGLACIGSKEAEDSYCSAPCASDLDCPAQFSCGEGAGGKAVCKRRVFCNVCQTDEQCGAGNQCVQQGNQRFCASPCNAGSTECPGYAECTDVGGGSFQCLHRAGTCIGGGDLCDPCLDSSHCAETGMCLTFSSTREAFCSTECGAGGKCPSGYACQAIGTATGPVKQCVPSDPKEPKCVSKIQPMMLKGDIMDDFGMVAYVDTDGDGLLSDETEAFPVHLSDFADQKIILFTISAGWCGPCQVETKSFKTLLKTYGPQGLAIVQVLFDGQGKPSVATLDFAKLWIKELGAVGAVGVDPYDDTAMYNNLNGTPLNFILDAKTRKVLDKFTGVPASGLNSTLKKYFP